MQRLLSAILIFLLCSGFMGIEGWYTNYGIHNIDELKSIEVMPKLITVLNCDKSRHIVAAAVEIGKFGTSANKYFPEIVEAANNDITSRHENVMIAVGKAAMLVYEKGMYKNDLEKLVLLEIHHPGPRARHLGLKHIDQNKIYTNRIIQALEVISLRDADNGVKQVASKVYNRSKIYSLTNSKKDEFEKLKLEEINLSKFAVDSNPYAIAVVIGNMDYASSNKSVPNVDYAINDAKQIKDILVNVKGFRDGNIIYLENATQADIVSTFGNKDNHQGKLFNWVRPESDVFVYYSGHGAPSLKDGSGYILPVDADPSTVELNGYPLNTLYQNIGKLQAKSITIVIDACFSGSSQGGTITKNASSISLKPITMPKAEAGINVLAAANVGEVASWDTEAQHSLFTSYFIKALNGAADKRPYGNEDLQIDLAEVQKFVNLEVTYMARRNYGRDQNPQISGNPGFVFSSLKE